jgi:hypothetical protein
MIDRIYQVLDGANKVGTLLPFADAAATWTTRVPLSDGTIKIGQYVVPANKTFKWKGLQVIVQYADIPNVGGFGARNLGSVYFQVDSTTKMEYRATWAGGTLTGFLGGSTLDINWRNVGAMLGAMNFTSGQVIRLVVSPSVSAGLVPQILWLSAFVMKNATTGATIINNARQVTTTGTANQVINTYTVPAGGVILKDINLQPQSSDFCLGMIQIRLNGALVLETPAIDSPFVTSPRWGVIPLYDGLTLNHGDVISFSADPLIALKQTYQCLLWGTEIPEGGGGGEHAYGFAG